MTKDPRYGMCKEEKWVAWGISVLVLASILAILIVNYR